MDHTDGEARLRLRRCGSGYAAEATEFYVWDEDPVELIRCACELVDAVRGGTAPPRRCA